MDTRRQEQQYMAYERFLAQKRDECATDLGFLAVNTLLLGTVSPHDTIEVQSTSSPEYDRSNHISSTMADIAILKMVQRPQPNEIDVLGYADYEIAA